MLYWSYSGKIGHFLKAHVLTSEGNAPSFARLMTNLTPSVIARLLPTSV